MAVARSRTDKSIKNSKVALIYTLLGLVVAFFYRRIFIHSLGSELLGLNTTVVNLLQFLNLTELGIGGAITFTLYNPLHSRDMRLVNEIISVQGWLYRNVAYVIMGASFILLCFFPLIFQKSSLPLWYAYATFIAMLFNSLLGYFVNYRQIVLIADQQSYKVQHVTRALLVVKMLFQMLAIKFLPYGYHWWLVLEVLFAIVTSVVLNMMISRSIPELKSNIRLGRELRGKYREVITKTKQLFVHKIATFVLHQTQPLIIYGYTTLSLVAYYGNYMMLFTGITVLLSALFYNVDAGVGSLIAAGDRKRIIDLFEELFSVRFLLVSSFVIAAYCLTPSFIELWLGDGYLLEESTMVLMLVSLFISGTRKTVEEFIQGYGLFHDVWAPVTESLLNLGLSILLGSVYGINGVIVGAVTSLVLIVLCWKPYFLFKHGLKESIWIYIKIYAKHILSMVVVVAIIHLSGLDREFVVFDDRITNFVFYSFVILVVVLILNLLLLSFVSSGMRRFILRIFKIDVWTSR